MIKPYDIVKKREICFAPLPPDQAAQALAILDGLDDLEVQPGPHPHSILVTYSVLNYTLEGLESALVSQGFHLDNSLLQKIMRALIHYCEEVQCENLHAPERLQEIREREIFTQAYEHHPHGDQDETPEEWREYR